MALHSSPSFIAANLFIVPLDDQHVWYRYHHLFGDLLRARLQQSTPTLVPALHVRAAQCTNQNGFATDAVHHAFAAQDLPRVADVIERHAPADGPDG